MATEIKTAEDFRTQYRDEVQAEQGELTDFSPGSMHDSIAGAFSIGLNEVVELIVSQFTKTFFDTAQGPEITGGPDDLQTLAVDHFGTKFARPQAVAATGLVDFSRPADTGDVTIPAGTIVKTEKDINGNEQRFSTDTEVTLTGLSLAGVAVTASEAGADSSVDPGKIIVIESALSDPAITVTNPAKMAGGVDAQTDAEYRETIRNLINTLAGATKAAIEGALLSDPSITFVSLLEEILPVIEWDIGAETPKAGEVFFRIPFPVAYVADAAGSSSPALLAAAAAAIEPIRACGVKVTIKGAVASPLDWDASFTLNPSGPNFATLSTDPTMILDSMKDYINKTLLIGDGFNRASANAAILAIWGPSGTDDLTTFVTNTPTGDIAAVAGTKIIAGTISKS